jgi:membrane protein implicated in regulation of membrane protease activity
MAAAGGADFMVGGVDFIMDGVAMVALGVALAFVFTTPIDAAFSDIALAKNILGWRARSARMSAGFRPPRLHSDGAIRLGRAGTVRDQMQPKGAHVPRPGRIGKAAEEMRRTP